MSMSVFHSPGHATMSVRAPSSLLSSSRPMQGSLLSSAVTKGKLGFSIDSIVGPDDSASPSDLSISRASLKTSPVRSRSPYDRSPRDRSPVYRPRSPRDRSPIYRAARSPSPIEADYKRTPSPLRGSYPRSESPSSPSLVRPIPTSLPGGGGGAPPLVVSAQSYLDQLASLKAFYEARGQSLPTSQPSPILPPGLGGLPGLPPMLHGLPRPPPNMQSGLPPFLNLPGMPGSNPVIPPHIPREYPLYPWFINRHRFPGGKLFKTI